MNRTMKLDDLRTKVAVYDPHRWYGVYLGHGGVETFVNQLRAYLQRHRLTDFVTGIRLERGSKREFYFALTFETDVPMLMPDAVKDALDDFLQGRQPIELLSDAESLTKFFGREVKVDAFWQQMTYRRLLREELEDPFAVQEIRDDGAVPDDSADRLLWYLSALGRGRWATFQATCRALGFSEPGDAGRMARRLRLLGHLEVSANGETWSVTPPMQVVAATASGVPLRFATGARTPDAFGLKVPQPLAAPQRLALSGRRGNEPELADPAAAIAGRLPDVDAFIRGLPVVGGVSVATTAFARFDGSAFVPGTFDGNRGFYELTQRSGEPAKAVYFDGETWRSGDWTGLRYLALRDAGDLAPARFDANAWRLALPHDQRPPEAYERVLVLASGLLPRRQGSWWVYENVKPELVHAWAERVETPIAVDA